MHIGIAKCAERRVAMYSRNYGCRITDQIIMDGNKAVVMENQKLRLTFLADRGMDCVEMLYKPEDIDFMWRSPAGLHKRSEYLSIPGTVWGITWTIIQEDGRRYFPTEEESAATKALVWGCTGRFQVCRGIAGS